MSRYNNLKIYELYAELGFKGKSESKLLNDEAHSYFLRIYSSSSITASCVDTSQARKFALCFLADLGQGPRFWSREARRVLVYEEDFVK